MAMHNTSVTTAVRARRRPKRLALILVAGLALIGAAAILLALSDRPDTDFIFLKRCVPVSRNGKYTYYTYETDNYQALLREAAHELTSKGYSFGPFSGGVACFNEPGSDSPIVSPTAPWLTMPEGAAVCLVPYTKFDPSLPESAQIIAFGWVTVRVRHPYALFEWFTNWLGL
jgi:hypothetical protein